MADKQFAAYIRLLKRRIELVKEMLAEGDSDSADKELAAMLEDFQKSLED